MELPAIPQGLTYDAENETLVDSEKLAIYRLDQENSVWVPLVGDEITALIGNTPQPQQDDLGEWVLLDENGNLLYTWDAVTWEWIAAITVP